MRTPPTFPGTRQWISKRVKWRVWIGQWEWGEDIGEGFGWEVTESFPPAFPFTLQHRRDPTTSTTSFSHVGKEAILHRPSARGGWIHIHGSALFGSGAGPNVLWEQCEPQHGRSLGNQSANFAFLGLGWIFYMLPNASFRSEKCYQIIIWSYMKGPYYLTTLVDQNLLTGWDEFLATRPIVLIFLSRLSRNPISSSLREGPARWVGPGNVSFSFIFFFYLFSSLFILPFF
jgi:hypothetical protein